MYERWSVGEDPTQLPNNIATNCGDQGSGLFFPIPMIRQWIRSTPYISLHVHGSNMKTWEKDQDLLKRCLKAIVLARLPKAALARFVGPPASGFIAALDNPAGFFRRD